LQYKYAEQLQHFEKIRNAIDVPHPDGTGLNDVGTSDYLICSTL